MKRHQTSPKHVIDVLFPITLFLVLTISALMLIMLGANLYEKTAENSYRNHQSRIALSYISEKVHQNSNCKIFIEKFEEIDSLIIEQEHQGNLYYTYIYYYDGALRELFLKENTNVSPENGKAVLRLQDFSLSQVDDGLLYFSCTDLRSQTSDSYVHLVD